MTKYSENYITVAETMVNPFGEDDDDFEVSRICKMSYNLLINLCGIKLLR